MATHMVIAEHTATVYINKYLIWTNAKPGKMKSERLRKFNKTKQHFFCSMIYLFPYFYKNYDHLFQTGFDLKAGEWSVSIRLAYIGFNVGDVSIRNDVDLISGK